MEPPQQALVETIRSILGEDAVVSSDRIVALLAEAENDPNKAVDLYFQYESMQPQPTSDQSQAAEAPNMDVEMEDASDKEPEARGTIDMNKIKELNELLGGQEQEQVLCDLLLRTNHDLSRAVELYFAEKTTDKQQEEEETSHHPPAAPITADTPIEAHPLEPLAPPHPPLSSDSTENPSNETENDSPQHYLGSYEVTMVDGNVRWQIGNVFGRAVVQHIDPEGPAAAAGIHKSDVLLSIGEMVVTEKNCNQIVQELSKERITVPLKLRFRRSPDSHPEAPSASRPLSPKASESTGTKAPAGFAHLFQHVETMMDAIGHETSDIKVVVDLLLLAQWNMDVAVNNFLSEQRMVPDFRQIVGFDYDPTASTSCLNTMPYDASIPAGPLGLTVENILERTIIVDIKPGGAAERASVKRSSWLVALNGTSITNLTHKEALRMIETATRPLQLKLVPIPPDDYKLLRKQLSMSIRQPKTERPVPEQDRMSFRVFQQKIELAIESLPKIFTIALFQFLTREELQQLEPAALDELLPPPAELDQEIVEEATNTTNSDMGAERRYLVNIFRAIHENDDKGESIVIRTIKFLGLLAKKCADMKHFVDARAQTDHDPETARATAMRHRYLMLLSVVMHVLESLSIIENHATWDVMVASMKLLVSSLTESEIDQLIVPMLARLSISPSPTARIVPASLIAMVYLHVHGDIPVQLRGMLDRMCSDDNPLVRRAVASIIGDLANAAGTPVASWTVQLLEKATADSHDIVRIFAVKSCIQLATALRHLYHADPNATKETIDQSLRLLYCQMVPMVNTYSSDSSWQVRLETAKTLPAFCRAFGMDYTDVFVDHFVGMVRDLTVEVRKACAETAFDLAKALVELAEARSQRKDKDRDSQDQQEQEVDQLVSDMNQLELKGKAEEDPATDGVPPSPLVVAAQNKIVRSILPATYGLSTDVAMAVRLGLAKSIGQSLCLVDVHHYEDFIPILTQFLDDSQDAMVRASLLEEMARHCDPASDTVPTMVFPCIKSLVASTQWRVRVKAVHCIAAWAERFDGTSVPIDFADACLEMLLDPVCEVRSVACSRLPVLAKSLGNDWLAEKAVPKIADCLQATFNGRQTGLLALESLAPQLQSIEKLSEVIEIVVEECTSKVANMRFRALRTLGIVLPVLNDRKTTESVLEIVQQLTHAETESDADVRETAVQTQAMLERQLQQ